MDTWIVLPLILLAAALGILLAGGRAREREQADRRLAAVERKLDLVLGRLGVAEPPPEEPDVVAHLERGETIPAIKAYRDRTGVSLAEAKRAVERIAAERGLTGR